MTPQRLAGSLMMSTASVATQQSNAMAAAIAATQPSSTSASTSSGTASSSNSSSTAAAQAGQNALASLSGNFNDFLNMLLTQLQNQDPTSPMDTNEFTSELVEFTGVEQEINTNSSLTQLIQLTQAGEVMQGSAMAGKQVTVTSSQIPLQNGSGSVQFTAPAAEPVAIAISTPSGQQVRDVSLTATAGQNTWTWNGADNSGNQVPDGAYNISVIGANADGSTTPLTFTVTGTATGVQGSTSANGSNSSTGAQLELGALNVPFSSIVSVGN
jgi:flagellar basal-body rod modification protein FlgD